MNRYNPKEIEPKWQGIWDETGAYTADLRSDRPKYIAMSMFNYPSGAGIHIGHAMNYTISDVKARFKRQQGYESYHPIGWDAFGLPAENFAIKSGVSPQESMATIIPSYHKQYKAMGWSNDWEKEISTHLPEYYKWTQWIFWKMHEQGLAYQDSRMQWWCELDNSVLANEQVIDGKCWRHDGADDPLVEKREVKQWFFRITDYADELLDSIDALDWTESVKLAQKNWIGKSKGAEVDFALEGSEQKIAVFTTRPDTLYGATFMVLAPEHELVSSITTDEQRQEIEEYARVAQQKSELERQTSKEKTGVFTGAYALNPVNGAQVPIWIADYVLEGYGTGAIMAVPAHDERDNEFAHKYNLPIKQVVADYVIGDGNDAPRKDVPTRNSETADAIITDGKGKYLLQIEGDEIHFAGGGVDETDASPEDAVAREAREETGYDKVLSVKQAAPYSAYYGYRAIKKRNNRCWGAYYEVVVDPSSKVPSEVEDGMHEVAWFDKSEVASRITWEDHLRAWNHYIGGDIEMDVHEGLLVNSGEFDGQETSEVRENIVAMLAEQGKATEKVNYKMRDWSVSRQRYWGAPIPIINCEKCGAVRVPESDLPIILPELDDFQPSGDGRSALARATDWLKTTCPECGGEAERETDTLDTYICSSWYMYRYFDPRNTQAIFDSELVKKWEPIDFYNGADHATAHLLYARFIGHFFKGLGLVNEPEPFKQFLFNGKVTAADGTMFSKSKGNGVDPLEIIDQGYGADALRTYLMFAAPLDTWARWDPQGVPGTYRFLSRIWTLVHQYLAAEEKPVAEAAQKEILRATHQMIRKVSEDIEENHYNTAIAAAMTDVNELYKLKVDNLAKSDVWQEALSSLVACVAPFAPHIADELWLKLGHHNSVQRDSWPDWKQEYLTQDTMTIAVQVNGKLRGTIEVEVGSDESVVLAAAKADTKVATHLDGVNIVKSIYVPNKLVNFVVK